MRGSRTLVVGLALLALMAVTALALSSWPVPRQERVQAAGDVTGVYCIDGWLDLVPPFPAKGQPHDSTATRSVKYIVRVEPSTSSPGDWDVSIIAYTGPDTNGDGIPDQPPNPDPDPVTPGDQGTCMTKGDGNSLDPRVGHQIVNTGPRPVAIATLVEKPTPPSTNLEWDICSFEEDRFGGKWVQTHFNLVVDKNPATQDNGQQTATLYNDRCGGVPFLPPFSLVIEAAQRPATVGTPSPSVADDWDGDGCSDWDELARAPAILRDPFNPLDCDADPFSITNLLAEVTPATTDIPSGAVTPGAYFHCITDNQPGPGGPTTIVIRLMCYVDIPGIEVNPHTASEPEGDGLPGPRPPTPYAEVHARHTQLTGTIDGSNLIHVTGCFGANDTPHGQLGTVYVDATLSAESGKGSANIHTAQPANCAGSPVGTPQVATLHWSEEPKGYDHDRDNCADKEELSDAAGSGGLRDPYNWGDFMSVHTGPSNNLQKDAVVSTGDISAIVGRFGSHDSSGTAIVNRNTDPKSTPPPAPAYHPSYDRGGPIPNGGAGGVQRQLPANVGIGAGAISTGDISAAVAQFGHSCIAPP